MKRRWRIAYAIYHYINWLVNAEMYTCLFVHPSQSLSLNPHTLARTVSPKRKWNERIFRPWLAFFFLEIIFIWQEIKEIENKFSSFRMKKFFLSLFKHWLFQFFNLKCFPSSTSSSEYTRASDGKFLAMKIVLFYFIHNFLGLLLPYNFIIPRKSWYSKQKHKGNSKYLIWFILESDEYFDDIKSGFYLLN